MRTVSIFFAIFLFLPFFLNAQSDYRSPYSVRFSIPENDLIGDILHGLRGNRHEESFIPYDEWESPNVKGKYGKWGPPARHYHQPEGIAERSGTWERERVIAVALRYQGYHYRHHHIPDWDAPELSHQPGGKGIDCSNFTSFVYNQALGLKPSGDIQKQSEQLEIPIGGTERFCRAKRIERPDTVKGFIDNLKTGDLLYIKSKDEIAHVIIWVGSIGLSSDETPLIIDSTGTNHKDSNGVQIPDGVHLRPFTEKSWYFKECSHILRYIHKN